MANFNNKKTVSLDGMVGGLPGPDGSIIVWDDNAGAWVAGELTGIEAFSDLAQLVSELIASSGMMAARISELEVEVHEIGGATAYLTDGLGNILTDDNNNPLTE